MADFRPPDPRSLFEAAADRTGDYTTTHPETVPAELRDSDLPAWAMDPEEVEQVHEADSTGSNIYEQVPIEYLIYLVVESGDSASDRADARASLDTLFPSYVSAVLAEYDGAGYCGRAQKTGRGRVEVQSGESIRLVDAITFEVSQTQIYS